MIKRLFYLGLVLSISLACSNQSTTSDEASSINEEANQEIAELSVANFNTDAGEHIGNNVRITGTVNHTCKHSGKRMFIVDEDTEENVKIEAGENIDNFDAELEGSVVVVTGTVKAQIVDEAYLDEWENEIIEGDTEEMKLHDGEHAGQGNHGEGESQEGEEPKGEGLTKINNLRTMLSESGKDHLAFYSLECISYEVLPQPQEN